MIDTHHHPVPPVGVRPPPTEACRRFKFRLTEPTRSYVTCSLAPIPFPYQVDTNTHYNSVGAAAHDRSHSALGVIGARLVRPSRGRNIDLETVRNAGQSVTTYPFCLLISVRTASLLPMIQVANAQERHPLTQSVRQPLTAAVPGWGGL